MPPILQAALAAANPFDLALAVIAIAGLPLQSFVSGRRLARAPRGEMNLVGQYWLIVARSIFLSLLILADWHWAGRLWRSLGLDMPVGAAGRAGFAVDALLACYYAYALLIRTLSPERIAAMRRRLDLYRILPRTRAERAVFPLVGLFASPFEELLYRGFLIWFFTPLAGLWGAAIVSSALFGLAHAYQGAPGILRTGLIGLVFAAGYALTQSLWWLMVAHMLVSLYADLIVRRLNVSPQQ